MKTEKTSTVEQIVLTGETQICGALGISRKTFHRYLKADPEFARICAKNKRKRRMAIVEDLKNWVRDNGQELS